MTSKYIKCSVDVDEVESGFVDSKRSSGWVEQMVHGCHGAISACRAEGEEEEPTGAKENTQPRDQDWENEEASNLPSRPPPTRQPTTSQSPTETTYDGIR